MFGTRTRSIIFLSCKLLGLCRCVWSLISRGKRGFNHHGFRSHTDTTPCRDFEPGYQRGRSSFPEPILRYRQSGWSPAGRSSERPPQRHVGTELLRDAGQIATGGPRSPLTVVSSIALRLKAAASARAGVVTMSSSGRRPHLRCCRLRGTWVGARGTMASAFAILPRSLHLPVAVTEGRAREHINKNGVLLWTGCSGDPNPSPRPLGKVGTNADTPIDSSDFPRLIRRLRRPWIPHAIVMRLEPTRVPASAAVGHTSTYAISTPPVRSDSVRATTR